MAKKKKDTELTEEGKEKKGHGLLNLIIVILILILWFAIFAVIVKLDIGRLGTMLRPALKDVPIVNTILPDVSDEQEAEENDYPYTNMGEAIARIKELEEQLAVTTENKDTSIDKIAQLQAEVDRLKVFEDNQKEFEDRVKEFEEKVVFAEEAPPIEEYKAYYESINPTNAELIYEQVIKQLQFDQAIVEKADMYKNMKPKDAAAILEAMTADTEAVANILMAMKPKNSGLILAQMDRTAAAKITKKMLDLDEEKR